VRIIGVVVALGFALWWGFVFVGMSLVGDPNVLLASVGIVVCLVAAVVIGLGPAKVAAVVAIALGVISGLAAVGTLAMAPAGLEAVGDTIWLGLTTIALIGVGIRLVRPQKSRDQDAG
jgi:hypothetical protein